jgi:hypothetical protein
MPNWGQVQDEIVREQQECQIGMAQLQARAMRAIDTVRRRYLEALKHETGRHVIAYYSAFLSKPEMRSEIQDEDKNGFMQAVHRLKPRMSGLDLILHTHGGSVAATQSIVSYLQKMFDGDIRAIVPQIAMSAGTMIACSCKEIVMGKQSNLGPIDPHLDGKPAYGVIEEFNRAYKEVKADPMKAIVWQPIIGQYRPTFLSQCENAIKWSSQFVTKQLGDVMFAGTTPKEKAAGRAKAKKVVKALSDYSGNRSHARHIHLEECKSLGLKILELESDPKLQDLVLTVHHCYMHALMNSGAYKIIENNLGDAFIKQVVDISKPLNRPI